MAETVRVSVRVDKDVKEQCEKIYKELGLNLSTAVNVFLRQSARAGGFPFEVTLGTDNSAEPASSSEENGSYNEIEDMIRDLMR